MQGELKEKVASGVAWSLAEKVGSTLFQLGVSLVLLRLLGPGCYNDVAMLTAFSVVALVIVDSGFSQVLIRKAAPRAEDYKSVFVFNLVVAVVLYLLLVAVSPWVAEFYGQPDFRRVAPVFFLLLPMTAFCSVQNTLFARQFRFALLSKVTFAATAVSGFAAVALALSGVGLWSIVAQRVLLVGVRAALLWWISDWRPRAPFSRAALREMAPNSFRLMGTDLISALYTKLPQLFIGRLYAGTNTLAYFDQAQKLKDSPVTSTVMAVQGVIFPALSKINGNDAKFAESYRQITMVVSYAMFPMMLGLSAVAPDLFALLGEKWMPTVPYFEAICLVGLFYPLAMISLNVLKVRSDGRIILRIEVLKKVIMTVIFALTIPRSVMAVVWGLVAISVCEVVVNFAASRRFTSYGWGGFVRTLLPVAAVSAAMYGGVLLVAAAVPGGPLLRLMAEVAAGVVIYVVLSALFRLEAFAEVLAILKKQVARK